LPNATRCKRQLTRKSHVPNAARRPNRCALSGGRVRMTARRLANNARISHAVAKIRKKPVRKVRPVRINAPDASKAPKALRCWSKRLCGTSLKICPSVNPANPALMQTKMHTPSVTPPTGRVLHGRAEIVRHAVSFPTGRVLRVRGEIVRHAVSFPIGPVLRVRGEIVRHAVSFPTGHALRVRGEIVRHVVSFPIGRVLHGRAEIVRHAVSFPTGRVLRVRGEIVRHVVSFPTGRALRVRGEIVRHVVTSPIDHARQEGAVLANPGRAGASHAGRAARIK
jgi:hypothetical protein